jgi:hypothetical protein
MGTTVCLAADTLGYPEGGGHLWVYLNWALGLRACGCQVFWMEQVPNQSVPQILACVSAWKHRLARYGLAESLVLYSEEGQALPPGIQGTSLDYKRAADADLLLNLRYSTSGEVVRRFRRSALLDIDPGLLQSWMQEGLVHVARHDLYFTIGETVGQTGSRFPDGGLRWQYTPPCVALDRWPISSAAPEAPFTTISHWSAEEWMGDETGGYRNDKRSGFLPFLEIPQYTTQPLELALCLGEDEDQERQELRRLGWRVRDTVTVASTPWGYQQYIQRSRGEFSCAKPSCLRLQNAWVSDRTLCYLASGKPAIVQHTGPSRFLPEAEGLFRFRERAEAVRYLETAAADYDRQCSLARALAAEYFEARKVVAHVLERALA